MLGIFHCNVNETVEYYWLHKPTLNNTNWTAHIHRFNIIIIKHIAKNMNDNMCEQQVQEKL